jgi:hypothetical protein
MKTRCMTIDWLVPFLGVAVVAGSLMAATAYRDLERRVQSSEALTTTLERLYEDQKLSVALKAIHEGQADLAAQRLDLLLCDSILRINAGLASADPRTRAYVEDGFRKIALIRPKAGAGAPESSAQEYNEDQAAVERILTLALASTQTAQAR